MIGTKKFLALAMILLVMIAAFVGFEAGKHHAIMEQSIWIMEFYPEDAEFDVGIGVELDGNWYTYDGYIG